MSYAAVSEPIRVGIHSAEPIRLAGLFGSLETHPMIEAVSGDLDDLLIDATIGLLILDVNSSRSWMELLVTVRRARPDLRPIVIGPEGNEDLVMRSIMAGARAYLNASSGPFAVRQAVETVLQGLIWAPRRVLSNLIDRLLTQPGLGVPQQTAVLSPRERQVLDLIMAACSNREIAEELGIEERTVKAYVASLLRKTGADNRVSLSVQATQESIRGSRERRGIAS